MILHLVRHPRPLVEPGVCYGRLDLTAEGVDAAAARLAPLLPAGAPVWTSPLARCRALAERLHPAPRIDVRLAEMHFGDWEGRRWDDIGPEPLAAWAADVAGFVPPGGESAAMLQARALAFVAQPELDDSFKLRAQSRSPGNGEIVVVTHAGVMRVLLAHWLGLPPAEWTRLAFDYGTVTTVELAADGGAVVRRLNR